MKSSRRKQSKPIRVSLEGGDEAGAKAQQPTPGPEPKEDSVMTNNDSTENETVNEEEPMETSAIPDNTDEASPLNSDKKKSDFPTEYHRLGSQLKTTTDGNLLSNGHVNEEEKAEQDSSPKNGASASDFPTAYHRLGNELYKDQSYLTNGHSNSGQENNKDSEEKENSTQDSDSKDANGDVSFKSDGTRIFHPDAYCELCDREFCNKYFLKTHKANKHGIYDNAPSPFSMANFPFAPPQESFPPTMQPNNTEQASVPKRPELMNFLPGKAEVSLPPPQTMPFSEKSTSDSINPDMEDYCEICQKHFCNKYYLKKHKQDVHGITPDTSSSRRRPQLDTPPSSSTVTSAPLILPQNINSMANVMVLNPFVPPVIIQAQPFMAQHPLAITPSPQPVSVAPVISQSLPHSDTTPSISSASNVSPLPNDALRGMGVLNADLYCELCRKEFCNKYFLKLHMVNKHGMFSDDAKKFPGSMLGPMFSHPGIPEDFANLTKLSEIMKAVEMEKANIQNKSGQNESNVTYCNICNMEFSSKYSYKIHKMNIHGILTDGAGSPEIGELMKPDMHIKSDPDAELSRPPSQQSNSEAGASSMFGSMIAAKLADRVQCEICNKELCNKYFLKAHKLKLHGIDSSPNDKDSKSDAKSESKLREERGAKVIRDLVKEIEAQGNANKTPERPPERELVKLGIDPEAYCEICKKEFCSKYFLRTHKLKLHGIKTPKFERGSGNRASRTQLPIADTSSRGSSDVLNLATSSTAARVTSSEALVAAALSAAASGSVPAMSTSTAVLNTSPTMASEASDSFEKHTWRWKEPVNSSRVACEICNKELCNKYFLRTHKLNKHGISLEEQAKASPIMSNASSVEMPDSDTASSTSSTSEQTKIAKEEKRSQTLQKLSESLKLKLEDELTISTRTHDMPESCSLCNRQFKNLHKLQLHLMKDHSLLSPPKLQILPPGKRSLDWLNSQRSACHLCSAEFPDLLTLQLHLIQEHNAQVSLKPEPQVLHELRRSSHISMAMKTKYARSTKPKVYSCLRCDYKTRWLSNIYSHEERKHKMSKGSSSNYPCSICLKSFLYEHSYLRHLRDYHHQTDLPSKSVAPRKGSFDKSGFNCKKCGTKFSSRLQCIRHIREDHIRSAKSSAKGRFSLTVKKFTCKKCGFSTRISENLRRHKVTKHRQRRKKLPRDNGTEEPVDLSLNLPVQQNKTGDQDLYLTQSFKLQGGHEDSNFVPAVINMAVRSLVKSPVTVTFTLTPMEQ